MLLTDQRLSRPRESIVNHQNVVRQSLCQIGFLIAFLCATSASVFVMAADTALRRFIAADSSKGFVRIIDNSGAVEWEYRIGPLHDLQLLPGDRLLLQTNWTHLSEIDLKSKQVVWSYDSAAQNGNAGKKVEVHAFQRLPNGHTMIAESGPARIIEVDPQGKLVHEMKLQVKEPHPHRDTRLARKLKNGNYLVCHEGDGVVREYDPSGKIVWEFEVPLFGEKPRGGHGPEAFGNQCFCPLRLDNGNTLISTGNGHRVIEVNTQKEIVWQLTDEDLPGITLAWITTLQRLPNGNIVLVNCHAGPENPQIIEVNREKQVVWTYRNFEQFGNALTNVIILNVDGQPIPATL